jgi:hypothetical protein
MSNNSDAKQLADEDGMLPEYDFSGGVRGKHYQAYRAGHSVTIHHPDGEREVHYFTLAEGAVMLDPDVKAHFPDSKAVNDALRRLIEPSF